MVKPVQPLGFSSRQQVLGELRVPLAVVQEVATLLGDGIAGELNPQQLDLLTVLLRNVERLTSLVDGSPPGA